MSRTPTTAQQHLLHEIAAALGDGATEQDLVDLVVRVGWQPGPVLDPGSDHLEGVLDSGRRVPIEIRRAAFRRAG